VETGLLISSAKDQEYFSDGLSEQLIHDLARIPGLKVAQPIRSFTLAWPYLAHDESCELLFTLSRDERRAGPARKSPHVQRRGSNFSRSSAGKPSRISSMLAF
jgi:hypothetical protein